MRHFNRLRARQAAENAGQKLRLLRKAVQYSLLRKTKAMHSVQFLDLALRILKIAPGRDREKLQL
jgi:hypothetical protein